MQKISDMNALEDSLKDKLKQQEDLIKFDAERMAEETGQPINAQSASDQGRWGETLHYFKSQMNENQIKFAFE